MFPTGVGMNRRYSQAIVSYPELYVPHGRGDEPFVQSNPVTVP